MILKKSCDNCYRELVKYSFFSSDKKIYRYNNALLCLDCFNKISNREQIEEA